MNEVRDRARLVDASAFDGRGIAATVPRADIEAVLASADGPPELVLGVERRGDGESEGHTLRIEWDPQDLQELLRGTSGDEVTLVLDSDELAKAIDDDVEAHGLREAAAVFAIAVTTAAAATAGVGRAGPMPSIVTDGGGGVSTPITMVSDAGSSGPAAQSAAQQAPQLVSDAALSGASQSQAGPQLVSDAALSGASVEASAASQSQAGPQLVSDAALSGASTSEAAAGPQIVSDAATTGPVGLTPQQIVDAATGPPQVVSDAASSGPVAQAPESSGGGFSISAPDPTTTGIIAGGLALMITAAAFTIRGRRPEAGHFA
jgi:hypothetical protein